MSCVGVTIYQMTFDFEKPDVPNLTETVTTLARLSRFVIADITDAKGIPQELQAILPYLPSVPVRLLVRRGAGEHDWSDYAADVTSSIRVTFSLFP